MQRPTPEPSQFDREPEVPGRSDVREVLENPGLGMLLPEARADARAQEAFFDTYAWMMENTDCPPIDPDHMLAVWQHLEKNESWKFSRKQLGRSDPRKKSLLKSIGRPFRDVPTAMLLALEEVETRASAPADSQTVERFRRLAPIEEQIWLLDEIVEPAAFTRDHTAAILEHVGAPWYEQPCVPFTIERATAAEPEGVMQFTLAEDLSRHCLNRHRPLANLRVEMGELNGNGDRGTRIRLSAAVQPGESTESLDVAMAALRVERHLVNCGLVA
ncbi:MAG: hypothetical protein Q8Q11_03390 [bacterium]|nr:hypothetical protein [bacterium]MDZ4248311.1 hypothetical protein [Patescibacteria group bacterium]